MRTDISYHHGKERCSIYTSSIAGFIDSCCNRHIEWPLLVACHLSMYPTFVVYSRCCVPLQYWVGHICWLTSLSQLSHHKSIWSCPVLDDRFHWLTFSRDGCLEGWVCLNSQFPELDSHFLFITWPIYQSIHVFCMNIKSTNQTSSTHKNRHKSPTKLSNLTLSKYNFRMLHQPQTIPFSGRQVKPDGAKVQRSRTTGVWGDLGLISWDYHGNTINFH